MLLTSTTTTFRTLLLLLSASTCSPTTTSATSFLIRGPAATAWRLPGTTGQWHYTITFGISNPNAAASEQGGNGGAGCTIHWNESDPLPRCWTRCTASPSGRDDASGPEYFARIPLSGLGYWEDWAVDVREYRVSPRSVVNNATVHVQEGRQNYWCSEGATTQHCAMDGTTMADFDTTFGAGEAWDACQEDEGEM